MPIFRLPSTSVPNNWELSGLFDVEREGLQISLPFEISKMHSSRKEDGFLNLTESVCITIGWRHPSFDKVLDFPENLIIFSNTKLTR
jgi:hypothetical protein